MASSYLESGDMPPEALEEEAVRESAMLRLVDLCFMVVLQHIDNCESFCGIAPEVQKSLFEHACLTRFITPALLAKFDSISHIGRNCGLDKESLLVLRNDHSKSLLSLNLGTLNMKGIGSYIKPFSELRYLTLHGRMNTKDCQHIKALKNLEYLNLSNSTLGDMGLAVLVIPSLKHMDISFCGHLSSVGFISWAGHGASMPSLTHLDISHTKIDDVGLIYLSNILYLRKLNLARTDTTDAVVHMLSTSLHDLTHLNLHGTLVGRSSVGALANMSNLQYLDLSWNAYTSEYSPIYQPIIPSAPKLEYLDISNTQSRFHLGHESIPPQLRTLVCFSTHLRAQELPRKYRLTLINESMSMLFYYHFLTSAWGDQNPRCIEHACRGIRMRAIIPIRVSDVVISSPETSDIISGMKMDVGLKETLKGYAYKRFQGLRKKGRDIYYANKKRMLDCAKQKGAMPYYRMNHTFRKKKVPAIIPSTVLQQGELETLEIDSRYRLLVCLITLLKKFFKDLKAADAPASHPHFTVAPFAGSPESVVDEALLALSAVITFIQSNDETNHFIHQAVLLGLTELVSELIVYYSRNFRGVLNCLHILSALADDDLGRESLKQPLHLERLIARSSSFMEKQKVATITLNIFQKLKVAHNEGVLSYLIGIVAAYKGRIGQPKYKPNVVRLMTEAIDLMNQHVHNYKGTAGSFPAFGSIGRLPIVIENFIAADGLNQLLDLERLGANQPSLRFKAVSDAYTILRSEVVKLIQHVLFVYGLSHSDEAKRIGEDQPILRNVANWLVAEYQEASSQVLSEWQTKAKSIFHQPTPTQLEAASKNKKRRAKRKTKRKMASMVPKDINNAWRLIEKGEGWRLLENVDVGDEKMEDRAFREIWDEDRAARDLVSWADSRKGCFLSFTNS